MNTVQHASISLRHAGHQRAICLEVSRSDKFNWTEANFMVLIVIVEQPLLYVGESVKLLFQ